MAISVIVPICYYGAYESRRKAIVSVLKDIKEKTDKDDEIIVVEQNCGDGHRHEPVVGEKIIQLDYFRFNKSWCCNVGILSAKNETVCINDAEIICDHDPFSAAKRSSLPWFYGWDRLIYDAKDPEDSIVVEREHGGAEGGVVFFNRDFYKSIGGMNEFYEWWGNDDNDIARRAEIVEPAGTIHGIATHLWHERIEDKFPKIRERNGIWYSLTKDRPVEMSEILCEFGFGEEQPAIARNINKYTKRIYGR